MELVNKKIGLLDEKEKILSEQLDILGNDRKRKADCKGNRKNDKKIKKNNQPSLPYENCFNCNMDSNLNMELNLSEKRTFFATAVVKVKIANQFVKVRGFFDTGSQPNLVTYSFFHKALGKQPKFIPITRRMIGINGQTFRIKHKTTLSIHSWYDEGIHLDETFWIMPKEANWSLYMPDRKMNPFQIQNLSEESPFADPNYWKPDQVHLLFGIGFFAKAITAVIDRPMEGTALMSTKFGIIIFGEESNDLNEETGQVLSAIEYNEEAQLDKLLERLWKQDQVPTAQTLTKEQIAVEKHFLENYRRDSDGRFVVKIPLKAEILDFGSSRDIALKRFFYLERRFDKNPEQKEIYVEKMRELMKLGHMIEADKNPKRGELVYYIPHHNIPKDDRVVYDASCKTDRGISLNEIQMLGPKLQRDLFETIMRFRRHRIAIYADIKKMFNQVKLDESQWNLQRIFWRENRNEPLREYWLTVLIFGQSASPYLAVRSVKQTARDAEKEFPEAAKVIENDFYMDDCVTGEETEEKAIKIAEEVNQILRKAGFILRKWKSNVKSVIQALDAEDEKAMLFAVEEDKSSILGLKWMIDEDKFTFVIKRPEFSGKITKRSISSHVAQLYDPNGYINPVIIRGRMLIQKLWIAGVGWDDDLEEIFQDQWRSFWKDIVALEKFTIDRWIGTSRDVSIQVHGFSDSSKDALGANIYIRTENLDGQLECSLLTAKARVAPIKPMDIHRLELSAAEILSRLVKEVMRLMELESGEYFLWLDNSAAYHWINSEPHTLKTYVANRVVSIQENTDVARWRHIRGEDNPADLLTRGITPSQLINNNLWLHGPGWLSLPQLQWPAPRVMRAPPAEAMAELRVNAMTVFRDSLRIGIEGTRRNMALLDYTGNLEKAINILCYVARFVNIWLGKAKQNRKRTRRNQPNKGITPPSNTEKTTAMKYLIRKAQQEHLNAELTTMRENRSLPEKSKLESLRPILDSDGLIRLGGRLDRADMDYEMKHPYIIPNDSRLAYLLMEYAHRQTKHGGIQIMMQFLRQKYWIPKLRCSLRSIVHKCVVCVRLNAKMESQLMAELPSERVSVGKPFLYTGVDYAGPFELKTVTGSTEKPKQKCWIAIFVCLKTRAVHIEIVLGLTSIAFIACYERFIARRGRCIKLFSDNGTTFTGTDKELRKAIEHWSGQFMLDHLNSKGTEWHFMSPAAPHQGGIYEAAVKSMKFHLKRIVGQKVLPYEQFNTLLTQVEAILNSRPLNPLSDDPKDIQALTPGHFLVGEPLITPLPFAIDPKPASYGVKLWRDRQRMVGHFWNRWQTEYLSTLQERKKWRREKENIKIGQLVVLKSENFPPTCWALGRICELLPSKDGLVRNVMVETANNKLKRPVQKLCVLPIEPEPSD